MQFHIQNMTCGGCVRRGTEAIQALDPAAEVETDPITHKVFVTSQNSQPEIETVLAEIGYPAVQTL